MQPGAANRLLRGPAWLRGHLRAITLRAFGAHIGRGCFLRAFEVPCDPWALWIEDGVGLEDRVVLCVNGPDRDHPKILIRAGTYVNRGTVIDAFERVEIGRGCLIGPHCYIGDHDRLRLPGLAVTAAPLHGAPIVIGDDVFLGAGTVVTKGVSIGAHATVGAGSVVTRDVPPGATVAGVPARAVGMAPSQVTSCEAS